MLKKTLQYVAASALLAAAGCMVGSADDSADEGGTSARGSDAPEEQVGTATSADLAGSVSVTVTTGADDLRGSSTAFLSLQRADGSWTQEYVISHGTSANSTFTIGLTTANDNFDPCTT